jgi:hypothetical protein
MTTETDDFDYEYYVTLMNIYLKWFNSKNSSTDSFFESVKIDVNNSTNHKMELFYSQIKQYQKDNPKLLKYKNEDLIPKNTYILKIDGKRKKYSINIFPILEFLADKEWHKINWDIIFNSE